MNKVFVLIHLTLLTLLVFLGVRMLYGQWDISPMVVEVSRDFIEPLDNTESKEKEKTLSRQHYSIIEKRNIFKTALEEKKESPLQEKQKPSVEPLEKTSLDLKLLGTIILEPKGGFAIIKESRKKEQKRYQKGDTIQNAQIKAVLRGKVILHYKGKDEVLLMEEAKGSLAKGSFPPPVLTDDDRKILSRSLVKDALGNINKLMGDVRVRPHFFRSKPDGLLLYGIKKDSLFQTMGLKNGDIIMGVDGKKIETVDDALTFYEQLKEASEVNVQIKRRGKTKEIQYRVE